jgi:hypothetical protein
MFHVRKDILEYLDTQGIGQRALKYVLTPPLTRED